MRDHIRKDGSINHIVEHSTDAPEFIKVCAGQGYRPETCWSRGLAWAIYGFILSYAYTKKQEYLEISKSCANYFISHCSQNDYLTVVDFTAPSAPVYYDSTAGVCAACGMLEISKYVSSSEEKMYIDNAVKILKSTDENFCDYSDKEDSLVQMGTERYPIEKRYEQGVHIPIIYGDFFFVEAMLKLKGTDFYIW